MSIEKDFYKKGQIDFKFKVLETLNKRTEILKELEKDSAEMQWWQGAQVYKTCRTEIFETIKTINEIEL